MDHIVFETHLASGHVAVFTVGGDLEVVDEALVSETTRPRAPVLLWTQRESSIPDHDVQVVVVVVDLDGRPGGTAQRLPRPRFDEELENDCLEPSGATIRQAQANRRSSNRCTTRCRRSLTVQLQRHVRTWVVTHGAASSSVSPPSPADSQVGHPAAGLRCERIDQA